MQKYKNTKIQKYKNTKIQKDGDHDECWELFSAHQSLISNASINTTVQIEKLQSVPYMLSWQINIFFYQHLFWIQRYRIISFITINQVTM